MSDHRSAAGRSHFPVSGSAGKEKGVAAFRRLEPRRFRNIQSYGKFGQILQFQLNGNFPGRNSDEGMTFRCRKP